MAGPVDVNCNILDIIKRYYRVFDGRTSTETGAWLAAHSDQVAFDIGRLVGYVEHMHQFLMPARKESQDDAQEAN